VKPITDRWWFADAVAIAVGLAPLVIAVLLTPGDDAVSLFGWDIPTVCQWRRLFGISCPGCGLTRSFVYLAHLHLVDAFRMNYAGPPLFFGLAGFAVRSVYRIATGVSTRRT
jgi:hypothetical protein